MLKKLTLLAVGGLLCSLSLEAAHGQPTSMYPPEAIREDFQELYERLERAHFDLYIETPKAKLDAAFEETLSRIDRPMTLAETSRLFQQFVALGNVAHARIEGTEAAFATHVGSGGAMIPIDVRVRGDRAWITDEQTTIATVRRGDELLSLNGEPTEKLLQRMRGEVSADSEHLANTLIEMNFPRLVWELLGTPTTFDLIVQRDGVKHQASVEPLPLEMIREILAKREETSLSLSWTGREARMLSGGVAYLRPGPFYEVEGDDPWDASRFARFIDEAFEEFLDGEAERLIIDLRNNPGGDASFSDLMVSWLADEPFSFYSRFEVKVSDEAEASNAERLKRENANETTRIYAREYAARERGEVFSLDFPMAYPREGKRFEGEVFALINRHSYSNAVTVAAILQDYGFATILGEETADLATTLGAMERFELENTGIPVGFPKARIVRPSGDTARTGVLPDVEIETPIVESADDPVLRAAIEVMGESS